MYNKLLKYKSQFIFLVKFIIVCSAIFIIVNKFKENISLTTKLSNTHLLSTLANNWTLLIIGCSLSIINWFLEVYKWKTLVGSFKNINLISATKQSLASLTTSLLTPNRIGEYGAKAVYYPKNDRKKILFLNFIGNFSQMLVTVFFGIIGVILFQWKTNFLQLSTTHLLVILVLVFTLIIVHASYKKSILNWWKSKTFYIHLGTFLKLRVLGYSILRYLVFSHQFYLLLILFQADINYFQAMCAIFSMYFIASIIPSFVVFDWLIKGSIAVTLFSYFHIDEITILSITSCMWLFNFALPATFGCYYVVTFDTKCETKLVEQYIKA